MDNLSETKKNCLYMVVLLKIYSQVLNSFADLKLNIHYNEKIKDSRN
jgi:hypothetical protein